MTHELEKLAAAVAQAANELDDAINCERHSSVELLDAVIESVRPALRALSSRVHEDSPERGIYLFDCGAGQGLMLTEQAEFVELWMDAEDKPVSKTLSIGVVARDFPLTDIIDVLRDKLERYANGNAGRTAKKALAKAERLRAITILLKQ